MVPTSALLLVLLILAARQAHGHPNPANLDALDCAVSELGVEFASARFPNDADGVAVALHSAFHLYECQNHSAAMAAAAASPQDGGYSAQLAGPEAVAASIYVSASNGSDITGDGSRARPFQSLHKVQAIVRKTPAASRPATTVFLRAGTYYLGQTLTLTAEDSGVVWSAFPGEAVTISGGIPLSLTWSALASSVPNTTAYKAALPADAPLNFSTLFVDGERAVWARYPNGNNKEQSGMCYSKTQRPIEAAHPCNGYAKATGTTVPRPSPKPQAADFQQAIGRYGDYPNFDIMVGGVSQPHDPHAAGYTYADLFESPGGMCIKPGLATGGANGRTLNCTSEQPCTVPCSVPGSRKWFAHFDRMQSQSDTFSYDKTHWTSQTWAHPERATVRFLGQPIWGSHAYPLLSMDQNKGTIQLGPGGWQFADIGAVNSGNNFYVEGVLEEVDSSFEWAIDYETRSLHYFPNQTMPAPPPAPSPGPAPAPSPSPGPPPAGSFPIELAGEPQCSFNHDKVPCCLDLGWWSHAPGAAFSMNNCHTHTHGNNQLFTATPALAPGTYSQLKIAEDGFCLTQGGCEGKGCPGTSARVSASPCIAGSADQLWSVDAATGALKSKEGACLHATAPVHDGSNLITTTCNSSDPNQKFTVKQHQPQDLSQPHAHEQQAVPAPTLVEAAILQRLVQVVGESASNPARHIAFRGVRFAHAATTQLERYEVPSGGDWAIARTGAVFIENAEHIEVSDSFFDQVGGNGVFLSKYARNCTVTGNRFAFPGDSAVASVGVSNLADGTAQTYPAFNTIANNWMHDIGTFGKQTSCYFQAVSGRNSIVNNTCYNGPRAGFNFNDGFLGGSLVEGNLIANMVRETGDHGPFNSWDRTPYNTRRDDGSTSTVPLPNTVTRNMIINGYNGVWSLDHDDGSSYYNDSSNFLVFGGCKNYKGDHKICGPDNVIIYPGIDGRSSGARSCQTNDNAGFKFNEFIGNKCVQGDGQFYTFSGNKADPSADPFTANNTFFSDGAKFDFAGGLAKMQAVGLDLGSTVQEVPSIQEIINMGRLALEPR